MNATTITAPVSANVTAVICPAKRPWPVIRRVTNAAELAWTPQATPLFTLVNGQPVRAGEGFAVVRPGMERWPLGLVSDHYKVVDHGTSHRAILEGASDLVTHAGAIIAGHGYHVAHFYDVKHLRADSLEGAPLKSRLVVTHDHTGDGATKASMVIYVGKCPMGAVIHARAMHVASQPTIWASEIDGMIEKAVIAQDLLLDLFKAAKVRELTDVDHAWLESKSIVSKKGREAKTLFEAMERWFEGNVAQSKMTWNVWSRRLDDKAIRVMCEMLGLAKFGTPLDEVLGGTRFGRGLKLPAPVETTEAAAE